MTHRFSVIICCYNSAERIVPTISALAALQIDGSFDVEIIIVDNNCTDATEAVVRSLTCEMPQCRLNYVYESRPGLSFARECGFKHATGEYLLLVDDDNQLDRNYLKVIHSIFENYPDVGIIGGIGRLPYEQKVPVWFVKYQGRYALGPNDHATGPVNSVYGAGMAIRKTVLDDLRESNFRSHLTDRSGKSLSSGGDSELCFAAKLLGWKIWRTSEARFIHAIPESRMTKDYLLRLTQGIGQSIPILSVYIYYERYRSAWLLCFISLAQFFKNCLAWIFWSVIRNEDALVKKERKAIYSSIISAWVHSLKSGESLNALKTVKRLSVKFRLRRIN